MSGLSLIVLLIVAFLAGVDVILDEWELAQPIVACTLVGMALGHVGEGAALGASLQLIALGWMNIGSAIPPDCAMASIVSAILVCGPAQVSVREGIALAIPLAIAGQLLNILVRTFVVFMSHVADRVAADGNMRKLDWIHYLNMCVQGLRIAIPAYFVTIISTKAIQAAINSIPKVITQGLSIAGGFIVAVGFAMVINMMANNTVWPFFFIGFVLAGIKSLNLIGFGILGVCFALIYLQLSPQFNASSTDSKGAPSAEDDIDAALDDL